jgi:hypothetical protein
VSGDFRRVVGLQLMAAAVSIVIGYVGARVDGCSMGPAFLLAEGAWVAGLVVGGLALHAFHAPPVPR